ncbi:hypothetical protein BKA57DRAFT_459237 [Linnemannia elongata]|nr:hypothetical protein BKA57DRAFT_459237 [Linnemannia elongata]
MYNSSNPTFAILAIICSSIGLLLSLIRLCNKYASAEDQQRSSTTTTPSRVVPARHRQPLTAQPVTRPFTFQPVTRHSSAAQPTSNPRSTVITIDPCEPPAPTYQPYLAFPPMSTSSSSPSSSSPLSYLPLAATSLSPAPTHPPVSQSQPPSYSPMVRTQFTSSEAVSTLPIYSASATS